MGECEGVFAYLDFRLDFFKKPWAYKTCYLPLLRTCNMLLRRLSKVGRGGRAPGSRAQGRPGQGGGARW